MRNTEDHTHYSTRAVLLQHTKAQLQKGNGKFWTDTQYSTL